MSLFDTGAAGFDQPYCGPPPLPGTLAGAWNLDPVLLAAMALAGIAGVVHLHRAGAARGRGRAFGLAYAAAILAFVSPLCALTVALFAARGLHHLLLIGVLAPALAVALPWRWQAPGAAFGVLSVALWAWHVPAVYAAAWDHAAVYWAMQAALVIPAWAFWSAVLRAGQELAGGIAAALPVAGLAGQMGLIGAILTFAPRPLYPEHLVFTDAFGFSPLADQQLAGLVMWVPGMLPFALVAWLMLQAAWRREARG